MKSSQSVFYYSLDKLPFFIFILYTQYPLSKKRKSVY